MVRIVIIILGFLSMNSIVYAQQCAEFNKPGKTRIYYVNGILSELVDNNNARAALLSEVGNLTDNVYRLSVNQTKKFAKDGYQAWRQRSQEVDPVKFWQQWNGTNPEFPQTSLEFQKALADAIVAAATVAVNTDEDLAMMVGQYLVDLRAGKRVVLVAHSQGNFYANRAQQYIASVEPELAKSLGIVAVATPSGSVAPRSRLTQNKLDTVLFDIVAKLYPVVVGNVSYLGVNDKRNHGFLTTYMQPNNGRSRIGNQVKALINQTPQPIDTDCDDRVAKIKTLSAIDVKATEATVRGDLKLGKNVDAWIIYDKDASNMVCSTAGQDGTGPHTASSILSQTVEGLSPNTVYYFRACGLGQKGGISDGGLKQFVTRRNSGKVSTPFPVTVTKDSFALKTEILEGSNIDVWFIRGAPNQTTQGQLPSCNGSTYDGVGTSSEGDIVFSGNFNDLEPDTQYAVRACAKGSDGQTNESAFNIVETSSVPEAVCSPIAFKGGTEGLSVIFTLGRRTGFASVTFETFRIADSLRIFKHQTNQLLLTTNGFISGKYSARFPATGIEKVDVYVTGNAQTNTEWELTIDCPR